MKVYKVVCCFNEDLSSTVDPDYDKYSFGSVIGGKHTLKYEIGVKTVPKIGRLFGFKKLKDAKEFFKSSGTAILEGEAENIGYVKFLSYIYFVEEYWRDKEKRKLTHNKMPAPKGTISFSSFIPTKVIYSYEDKKEIRNESL